MKLIVLLLALCGCYLKHFPLHAGVAKQATYKVHTGDSQGTAWAVGPHHLVTAGHVCETMTADFVIATETRRFHAKPILWQYSEAGDAENDLCVLETDAKLDSWLVVAERMPAKNERVGYVGYPLGHYYEGSGVYFGDVDGPGHLNDDMFSAKCDHGASGSAVYHEGGVWGVLVRLRTDGDYVHSGEDGCIAIPLAPLKKILSDAGVRYDVPPELPQQIPDLAPRG